MTQRHLTVSEKRLLSALLSRAAQVKVPAGWLDAVEVCQMNDGGMGSLLLQPLVRGSRMGKRASDVKFRDSDGVDVIASLNLDDAGNPLELDIWKVDFKPLIRIPDQFDENGQHRVREAPRTPPT